MRGPRLCGAAVCALALTAAAMRSVSAGCPDRSVVTADCGGACGGDISVCVRYSGSASAQADHSKVTASLNADANGCVVHCLEASVDPVLKVLTVRIPSNAPAIEDVAGLTLPAGVTGLDVWSDAAAIQTFGFSGGNIVANGTLLNFLGLHGISPETLPPAVYDLPLATLRLQLSSSDFPAVTARFKTINTLILDDSGLTAFPVTEVIGDMPQVRNLSLTGNAITQVPVDETTTPLYAASALRELALGQNKLTEFSAVFSSLHILDLHGNQLTTLPTSLAEMTVLEELRLSGNPLDATQLSSQLAAMEPLAGVELLSMSSCGLTGSLPEKFASVFASLTHLELAQNSLESIKADVVPEESLVFLNVSTNKLNSFEGSFPVLQVLDISHNQLKSLPTTLSASLRHLNASSNALTSLNISGLTALESLDLSSNKFSVFPASLVWDAPHLAVLRLSGNPDMAPVNLTKDQFEKLQGLTHLTMDEGAFGSRACTADWLTTSKHGISVCVTPSEGGELTKTPKETTAKVVTANPNNSRTAGAITTVVLAIGGVIFGVSAYLHSKKRRRKQQQQQALDHIHNGFDSGGAAPFGEAPSTSKYVTGGGLDATSRTKALSLSSTSSSVNIWNDDTLLHLRLDMDTIRFFKVVGMGAYGQVWRGTCRTSSTESRHVAIKTLAPDLARDRHVVKKFIAETKLQATLSHPRVVSVVGVAWNSPTDLCSLMEFMPRGDLFATLHYSSSSSCSSTSTLFQTGVWGESKLQIALDIIDALSFAHAQSPVVLHRDLKSRNVLLDAHGRAKLSDFSAATRSSRDESPTIASPLWTAPEVLAGAAGFDEKADVYSFGVILSELDTHEVPFGYEGYATTMLTSASKMRSKQATSPEDAQHKRRLLRQIAAGEIRPTFTPSCPPAILDIAQKCLSLDAALRPSAVEVNFLLRRVEREGSDARMSSMG